MGAARRDGPHLPREARAVRVETALERARRHGLVPKKPLGQHFLVSEAHVRRIVGRVRGMASVLEIGPGPATLTVGLCETVEEVVAVDIDPRVAPLLAEAAPKARLIVTDVLKLDTAGLVGTLPEPRAIVSNMPYQITGPLLETVFSCAGLIDRAVLMMQREVAERILAPAGSSARGALSVVAQEAFEVSLVARVPAGAFFPPPKVESAVLELVPKGRALDEGFRGTVRQGFRQPRKTLAGNLGWGREDTAARLAELGLPDKARPHELTGGQWREIAERWPTP